MSKKLTVFTPTYNRAYILDQLYRGLLSQSSKDFVWMIVDDGSSDSTASIVRSWIDAGKIEIKYIYQENMGMVAAHNTAISNIDSELFVCIDSDDTMPENSVECILETWEKLCHPKLMGIVGLDAYTSGKVIGKRFPDDVMFATFSEIKYKYKISGDKKYVLKTSLAKKALPYPFIKGEKFPAPSYIYLKLEREFQFALLNEVLCIVEYLPDGNSMNKISQYRSSPNAFALYRLAQIEHRYSYRDKFKNMIHYISSKLLGNRKGIFSDSPDKFTLLLAFPFGVLLYFYIMNTSKKSINSGLNKK